MEIIFKTGKTEIMLKGDEIQFTLCRKTQAKNRTTKEVETYWAPWKYFSGLAAALDYVMKLKIINSDATSLAELRQEIEKIRNELIYHYKDELK